MASEGSRLRSLLQIVGVAGLSAVLFVFAGWLAVRVAVSGPADEVPDLTGLPVQQARQQLESLGMQAEIDDDRLQTPNLAADHVARQIPGPGTPVKRMRVVRLLLSAGPRRHELPSMVGDSRARALIALQQQDFDVDYEAYAPSWDVAEDRIIAQETVPAVLAPGETGALRLLVSLGPPTAYYVMPDLVGQSMAQIRPWLESMGFRVSEGANRRVVANVSPGTIVNQRPQAGFRIARAGQIDLQVSR